MAWLRRAVTLAAVALVAAAGLTVLGPAPPKAQANVACDVGIAPGAAVTDAVGIGNPVGDACEAITDPVLDVATNALAPALDPLKDAASSIGEGVFDQITSWASDGAVWLIGEVVVLTNKTTTPNLMSKGFVRQYREMASVAVVLALLMLLFAVLESLGRGDGGMLLRVFLVNVPLAAIATSAAYVVVQLLIATTDGFSEAVSQATADDTRSFFKSAIEALGETGGDAGAVAGEATATGGTAGDAAGTVAVPLFVGFIVAIVAAFAAFLLWVELLMRDAAIYAVALFMPMAIAASIWPRWVSALKRTAELLIVVIFSKFVIVSVVALSASLLSNTGGKVEHVLAAGALLLLACFAPFVLFKLVPFAEGAVSSAYSRQGSGGVAVQTVQLGGSASMMHRSAQANWGGGSKGGGAAGGGGSGSGSASKGRAGGGGSGGAGAGEAAAGASGGAGAVALPATAGAAAVEGSKAAAGKLADSGTAQASGEAAGGGPAGSAGSSSGESGGAAGSERPPRPETAKGSGGSSTSSPPQGAPAPEPSEAPGGAAPGQGTKPPRPSGGAGSSGPGSSASAKGQS